MRFEPTPHGSYRFTLEFARMPETFERKTIIFAALDALCVWGGSDKKTDKEISWEFAPEDEDVAPYLERMVIRLGYKSDIMIDEMQKMHMFRKSNQNKK
jgi:hypothetical protein